MFHTRRGFIQIRHITFLEYWIEPLKGHRSNAVTASLTIRWNWHLESYTSELLGTDSDGIDSVISGSRDLDHSPMVIQQLQE
ncbi:hypothetical protein G9P44_001417 [Scheffersomyces stipitis]|nr:hypothetical protein G9P44_001417 [Scheffersomyces stipitis]